MSEEKYEVRIRPEKEAVVAEMKDRLYSHAVVLLKIKRVIYKIIIYSVIAYNNGRILYDCIQIDSLKIIGARIYFRIHCIITSFI